MPPRQTPRRIARELALLSLAQIKGNPEKLKTEDLNSLVLTSVRTIAGEVQETLETAAAEVKRGYERLLVSETKANTLESSKAMVKEALELTQGAINRLGYALDFPEFIQLGINKPEVEIYALELIETVHRRREEIDNAIKESLVDWQLKRLPQIDRDILRIAVAEIMFLSVPKKFAINEAVEIAKRYSDEDGYRFINGVLRRVTDKFKKESQKL